MGHWTARMLLLAVNPGLEAWRSRPHRAAAM